MCCGLTVAAADRTAERMQKLLRSGVHFAVRSIAMFAVWNTATAVAARVDTPTLAAHQVLTQLFMFLALMLDALAIPAQSLVAGALGADDTNEALLVGRTSKRLSLWCARAAGLGRSPLLSPVLPYVFSGDPAVHSRLTAGLLILAVMQFPGAIAFAFDGALIGAHDERWLARQAVINLARLRTVGDRDVVLPAARPGRLVGCATVVDDDARDRQLASGGSRGHGCGQRDRRQQSRREPHRLSRSGRCRRRDSEPNRWPRRSAGPRRRRRGGRWCR